MPLNIQDASMTVWRGEKNTEESDSRTVWLAVSKQLSSSSESQVYFYIHHCIIVQTSERSLGFEVASVKGESTWRFAQGKHRQTHRARTKTIKYTWDNKNGNNSEIASTLPWLKLLLLFYLIVIHSVFVFCIFWEGKFCILFAKVILFVVLQRLHFSFHGVKSYTEQV